jgi:regulator of protease activity HflC (stomatin/prohibitin superfamily)
LLKQKVSQIKARIKIINAHIKALKESELYKLMIKVEEAEKRGADLLGEMAKDLQMRIQAAREMLKSLRQQEA